jgi:hypothetical protein
MYSILNYVEIFIIIYIELILLAIDFKLFLLNRIKFITKQLEPS